MKKPKILATLAITGALMLPNAANALALSPNPIFPNDSAWSITDPVADNFYVIYTSDHVAQVGAFSATTGYDFYADVHIAPMPEGVYELAAIPLEYVETCAIAPYATCSSQITATSCFTIGETDLCGGGGGGGGEATSTPSNFAATSSIDQLQQNLFNALMLSVVTFLGSVWLLRKH